MRAIGNKLGESIARLASASSPWQSSSSSTREISSDNNATLNTRIDDEALGSASVGSSTVDISDNYSIFILEAEFATSVLGWLRILEQEIQKQPKNPYEPFAAANFVGTALNQIRKGLWDHLIQDPEMYAIPAELLAVLKKFVDEHPILLKANTFPDLTQKLCSYLLHKQINELEIWVSSFSVIPQQQPTTSTPTGSDINKVKSGVGEFAQAILKWNDILDQKIKAKPEFVEVTSLTYISRVLDQIRKGNWEKALKDPEIYEIPFQLLPTLNECAERYPALLKAYEYPQAAEQLHNKLLSEPKMHELEEYIRSISTAEFAQSVLGWVETLELTIKENYSSIYEHNAAATFVTTALNRIRKGEWELTLVNPENFGIPAKLLPSIALYVKEHPILLKVQEHLELAKELRVLLLRGEISQIYEHVSKLSKIN